MSKMIGLDIIFACFFFICVLAQDKCPKNCSCDSVRYVFNCSQVNTIPSFLHPNNIRVLSINSHNITEIKKSDFQGFYKLQHLNLSDGTIGNIAEHAFADLNATIELIKINNNNLDAIPENVFNNMPRLRTLEINSNRLKRLNGSLFTNLPKLNVIKFERNSIAEVDDKIFRNVPELEIIYYFQNQLTKIPFGALKNVPSLKYLYLGLNNIASVGDVSLDFQWQNLTQIALDSNRISDLTMFPNIAPNLEILDLGFNQFSTISPSAWTNLNSLNKLILNGNKLQSLNAGVFSGLKNLESIFLRNMPKLEYIGPRTFTDMKNLRYVELSTNPKLRSIHEDAFKETEITSLYLDHNNLTTLSEKLLPLETLAHISLTNNSWNCDCTLRWILDPTIVYSSTSVKSKVQSIKCSSPDHLNGTTLISLKTSDLVCRPTKSPENYKSRVQTGIIVAVVCFVVMTTFMIVMKCKKRIMLRVRKYYMYRRFKGNDNVFSIQNERGTAIDDVDELL